MKSQHIKLLHKIYGSHIKMPKYNEIIMYLDSTKYLIFKKKLLVGYVKNTVATCQDINVRLDLLTLKKCDHDTSVCRTIHVVINEYGDLQYDNINYHTINKSRNKLTIGLIKFIQYIFDYTNKNRSFINLIAPQKNSKDIKVTIDRLEDFMGELVYLNDLLHNYSIDNIIQDLEEKYEENMTEINKLKNELSELREIVYFSNIRFL